MREGETLQLLQQRYMKKENCSSRRKAVQDEEAQLRERVKAAAVAVNEHTFNICCCCCCVSVRGCCSSSGRRRTQHKQQLLLQDKKRVQGRRREAAAAAAAAVVSLVGAA